VKVHPFLEAEKVAGHNVLRCCELLEVARAAFYERLDATPSVKELEDAELTEKISAIHADRAAPMGLLGSTRPLGSKVWPAGSAACAV
jgi:putative transposase